MNSAIRELEASEYANITALIQLLEPELSAELIIARCAAMYAEGWRCIGAFEQGQLLGVAGYSRRTHFFSGPVLYVENVVLLPDARGKHLGEQLMAWLEQFATRSGCQMLTLDAYARNLSARNFYQRLSYDPRGVHFVKELSTP